MDGREVSWSEDWTMSSPAALDVGREVVGVEVDEAKRGGVRCTIHWMHGERRAVVGSGGVAVDLGRRSRTELGWGTPVTLGWWPWVGG